MSPRTIGYRERIASNRSNHSCLGRRCYDHVSVVVTAANEIRASSARLRRSCPSGQISSHVNLTKRPCFASPRLSKRQPGVAGHRQNSALSVANHHRCFDRREGYARPVSERQALYCLTLHAQRNNIVITVKAMHVTIRQIGNSQGVVIPRPLLTQLGLSREPERRWP
jgi:hypothetical protein